MQYLKKGVAARADNGSNLTAVSGRSQRKGAKFNRAAAPKHLVIILIRHGNGLTGNSLLQNDGKNQNIGVHVNILNMTNDYFPFIINKTLSIY